MAKKRESIRPDVLQQFDGDNFLYLPILHIDGVITSIANVKADRSRGKAKRTAEKYAEAYRKIKKILEEIQI